MSVWMMNGRMVDFIGEAVNPRWKIPKIGLVGSVTSNLQSNNG